MPRRVRQLAHSVRPPSGAGNREKATVKIRRNAPQISVKYYLKKLGVIRLGPWAVRRAQGGVRGQRDVVLSTEILQGGLVQVGVRFNLNNEILNPIYILKGTFVYKLWYPKLYKQALSYDY